MELTEIQKKLLAISKPRSKEAIKRAEERKEKRKRERKLIMKSYTDLEQSKKLAVFLPLESADMWWNFYSVTTDDTTPQIIHLDTPWVGNFNWNNKPDNIPCWSLAALLDTLSFPNLFENNGWNLYVTIDDKIVSVNNVDNPVDACVEMIIKLHEQKLL